MSTSDGRKMVPSKPDRYITLAKLSQYTPTGSFIMSRVQYRPKPYRTWQEIKKESPNPSTVTF